MSTGSTRRSRVAQEATSATSQNERRITTPFMQMITQSNGDLKAQRGTILQEKLKTSQRTIILGLEGKINNIEMELSTMLDFGPNYTTSLSLKENFHADEWAEKVQNLSEQLEVLTRKLEIANNTYVKLFGEIEI